MSEKILLILTGENDEEAEEAAFREAVRTGDRLVIMQVLSSDLYHYGRHDIIATLPTKIDFLRHVQKEVLLKGKLKREALKRKAAEMQVSVEVLPVETEDPVPAILSEVKKGDYRVMFLKKERRNFLPIFKRTIRERLERIITIPIRYDPAE